VRPPASVPFRGSTNISFLGPHESTPPNGNAIGSAILARLNPITMCSGVCWICQLDGLVARNFANQTSALGSLIDPLADKLLVSVVYITLTYVHLLPCALSCLVSVYTVSRKNNTDVACCSFNTISVIFGRYVAQRVCCFPPQLYLGKCENCAFKCRVNGRPSYCLISFNIADMQLIFMMI